MECNKVHPNIKIVIRTACSCEYTHCVGLLVIVPPYGCECEAILGGFQF